MARSIQKFPYLNGIERIDDVPSAEDSLAFIHWSRSGCDFTVSRLMSYREIMNRI